MDTNFDTTTEENFLKMETLLFSWIDYALFTLLLILSAFIGIYFGFFGKKQDSTTEYILGGRAMKIFPISMSLITSYISGITLLAVPADIYAYGVTYWLNVISMSLTGIITVYVYLPVFYKLQLTSTYEYLSLRFDPSTRILSSFLYTLSLFFYLPIVIYIPALAFSQVTGAHIHLITSIICIICIFYTTIGGLKAVVWTITLQFSVTAISLTAVVYLGLQSTSGFTEVLKKSIEGGRMDLFDFTLDPTVRTSFWGVSVGQVCSWTAYMAVSQTCVQKFLSMSSIRKVKCSILIFLIGVIIVLTISALTGLIMYSKYAQCDPLKAGRIQKMDQLLPYYVMDVAGYIFGLPGLFIAGLFCAALSNMSGGLSALSGTIYEDFVKPLMPKTTTEKTSSNVVKCIVLILGVFFTAMVFVVEHLGNLLPMSIRFSAIPSGPLLGMFTLGMLVPFANTKGTLYGSISGLIIIGWIVFGAQYHIAHGALWTPELPVSTDGCNFTISTYNINNTTLTETYLPFYLYRISFYYYGLIGFLVTIIVGIVVSLITGGRNQKVHRDLLSPAIYWLLPKEEKYDYNTVALANSLLEKNQEEISRKALHS